MVLEIRRDRLEADFALWHERYRIGWKRFRLAKTDDDKRAAIRDIKAAEAELESLKRLMALVRSGDGTRIEFSPAAAKLAQDRIDSVLRPRPSMPHPDRKRDKRLRDQEIRTQMKGAKLSDDSRGHGRRR